MHGGRGKAVFAPSDLTKYDQYDILSHRMRSLMMQHLYSCMTFLGTTHMIYIYPNRLWTRRSRSCPLGLSITIYDPNGKPSCNAYIHICICIGKRSVSVDA
jgi:hypothetical protein